MANGFIFGTAFGISELSTLVWPITQDPNYMPCVRVDGKHVRPSSGLKYSLWN